MANNGLIKFKQIDMEAATFSGDKNIIYHQVEPASIWEFEHGLDKIPSFDFYTEDLKPVMGDFEPIGLRNGKVTFNSPMTGYVVCN